MTSVRLLAGDAIEQLRTLRPESAQCCVTSPPYFGLRDYGVKGQIGLERTVEAYVARLVEVFREVRRVLKDDGVLWLNLGDSYATGAGKVGDCPGGGKQGAKYRFGTAIAFYIRPRRPIWGTDLYPKCSDVPPHQQLADNPYLRFFAVCVKSFRAAASTTSPTTRRSFC